ncbi:acyltransferase [Bacillus sp. BRMEA1]|uniref:acyltransferase n=1 Tax=Neobacillus endophyticus TaxID=2738405 RepID=UPI0015658683|nr:acyltransferase [Neobacillus endophyticus]NRD76944.1 acyltransferase [Neobacillus endophyticus]
MGLLNVLVSLPKTIYFNFKVFPFQVAKKLPVFIGYRTVLMNVHRGSVELTCNPQFGLIKFGHGKGSFGVEVNKHSYLKLDNGCKVVFHGKANLSEGISVRCDNGGIIEFGANFAANQNCFIASNTLVKFGDDVLLGWNINVRDSDGHHIYLQDKTEPFNLNKSISIGNSVWIASYANILKGSKISDNSIVGYGSLVTKEFNESQQILAGVPAKVVKQNITWRK